MIADRMRSWHATHAGTKRKHNEDTWVDRPDLGIWAVADGAGGHQAGEYASGLIAEALDSLPPELSASELLGEVRVRIAETHRALREEAERRGGNTMIASTLVAFLARGDHFACLWAGDSRAYMLRDGEMRQITKDHSLVQELVDAGTIAPERGRATSARQHHNPRDRRGYRRSGAGQSQRPAAAGRPIPAVQRRFVQNGAVSSNWPNCCGATTACRRRNP